MDLLKDEKSWVNIYQIWPYKFRTYDRNANLNANKKIRINLHTVKDELRIKWNRSSWIFT